MIQKINIPARQRARRLALQALYQWTVSKSDPKVIEVEFYTFNDMTKVDKPYFHELLQGTIEQAAVLDDMIIPFLDRKISELNIVELNAIRLACYELSEHKEVPFKVAINEAVELTKVFGTVEGYKYVNGVLDKIAKAL